MVEACLVNECICSNSVLLHGSKRIYKIRNLTIFINRVVKFILLADVCSDERGWLLLTSRNTNYGLFLSILKQISGSFPFFGLSNFYNKFYYFYKLASASK